jgi:hypothetical protein
VRIGPTEVLDCRGDKREKEMKRFCRLLLICLSVSACNAQIQITLNKDFINKFSDRVTIDTRFTVAVTSKIHPANQDGDIHVAGTAPEIGMVAVAEVMNAKTEKNSAVKVLTDAVAAHSVVSISGAWRIWCEHGGEQHYVQGAPVDPPTSSGEAHVFEVHPITTVNGKNIEHTWAPVPGFTYKDADQAFPLYERTKSSITDLGQTVRISTEQVGYNYTEFVARLNEDPHALADGVSVFAEILDTNGELLVHNRRLVFAKGTDAEKTVHAKHKGDLMQVVGIPRIDLALVRFRVENHDKTDKTAGALNWNLPYEMIVAAVTDPDPEVSE